jgi:transcription elongation factor GreB
MSKAFTKESDDADDSPDIELQQLPMRKNYITPEGHERLKTELQNLLYKERPDIVQVVSWAAGNGDRSENGDYLYGKKRLREIDRRIRFLSKRLEIAEVIDPASIKTDKVQFGATVTYANEEGVKKKVQIVGIDEIAPTQGKISWISPLAKVLLNQSVGDAVTFVSPKGEEELEILKIEYK